MQRLFEAALAALQSPDRFLWLSGLRTKLPLGYLILLCCHCPPNVTNLSGDLADMPPICTAATAPDVDVRKALRKCGHLPAKLFWIAIFKMPEFAQLQLLHHGRIGA